MRLVDAGSRAVVTRSQAGNRRRLAPFRQVDELAVPATSSPSRSAALRMASGRSSLSRISAGEARGFGTAADHGAALHV
jgi:hypothetical protein